MAEEHRHVNPWNIAISVMLATFMEVLDTSVVNVSLPHIAGSLSASIDEATWTVTSYLVANAIILPMTGWLASAFGRKRLLMLSVVGFTAASFLCGLAPTLGSLIFFRVVQGATGGALQPLSQAVLLEAFPPNERGKAMGFWGLGVVVAPILGPVLGGWLTDSYSWRWVFYINIPVGIASLVMTKMFIFDPPYLRQESRRVDYWGIGMLTVGLVVGGFTLLWLSWLNLQAGYWDFFWPQIIQGAGLSLLFVPLTTVSMDKIPREQMGNATSLFNLMRNIGGSIGIAVTGTMIARNTQKVTATLGAHVSVYDFGPQQMFLRMRAAFMAAGADAVTASNRAYAAMFGMVQRQAAMV